MKKINVLIKKYRFELFVLIFAFIFSLWLMFSTFSYENGSMQIASNAWSDFASHIPLIRSFSLGNNFPPQFPLFSGPPIKYHFIFYALVGILEKTGLRIDFALNILSALGFSLLILMIFFFSKLLFKKNSIAILSIIFFIFNGSLSFLNFFSKHPLSGNTFYEIITNRQFPSFGPYDPTSIVSAFWNLNIYTNQRHLALSYGISILLILFILKPFLENKKQNIKINLLIGILLGFTFFLNMAVFLMTLIILLSFFMFLKKERVGIFFTVLLGVAVALMQYIYTQGANSISQFSIYPGYLIGNNVTIINFINYWFQNLGLHLILMPLGFLLSPKKAKIILISFFALFVIGNLFKFSPEVAANHKFFNYFLIVGSMYSAYFIYFIWNKKRILRPFVPVVLFLIVFSGIIDFFPILNDSKLALADYPKNRDVAWIIKNTNPNSIFLNTQYLYDNASLAGRKIFLGWPYFAWSQGYDTLTKDDLRKRLLATSDLKFFCKESIANKIDYAELNVGSQGITLNKTFFDKNFSLIYKNEQTGYYLYNIKNNCL